MVFSSAIGKADGMKFLLANLFFFSLWSSGEAVAHPVSYKHALGVMSWNQPFLSDYWLFTIGYSLIKFYHINACFVHFIRLSVSARRS